MNDLNQDWVRDIMAIDRVTVEEWKQRALAAEAHRYTPVDDDTATSLLGEGIHTGLRKGSAQPEAEPLWHSIANAPTAWSDALAYAVDGLHDMGYVLCRQTTADEDAS